MNPTLVIIALIFGAVALVQIWISTAVPIAAPPSTFDHEHPSDPTTTILRTMGGRVYMKLTTQQRLTFVCAPGGGTRDVGLGPEHDWSSHAADAFGLMAIAYEEPSRLAALNPPDSLHTAASLCVVS